MTIEQKKALIKECREAKSQSGWPVKQWCETKGIQYTTYYRWVRQITKINKAAEAQGYKEISHEEADKQQWISITSTALRETEEAQTDEHMIKVTCGKFIIKVESGTDTQMLINVLTAVKQACC